jgi:aspartyl-tRNA(Asn)/glutamyl-tRNA(Gln) amidotransferase subunit C
MKRKISLEEVKHVATLANLPLTESEIKKFASQLSEVIDYNMTLLEKVETKGVEPTAHITGISNILREDETQPNLTSQEALQNAKKTHNNFFKVKAILDLPDEASAKAGQ